MFPLPLSQFEPTSRLILDVEGQHFCLAATPELAAQLVATMNTIGKLSVAAEAGQPSGRAGAAISINATVNGEHRKA